jgi:hypothetical protein
LDRTLKFGEQQPAAPQYRQCSADEKRIDLASIHGGTLKQAPAMGTISGDARDRKRLLAGYTTRTRA